MDELQKLCYEFISARNAVKSVFKYENSYIYPVCANIFCARGILPNEGRLLESKQILKDNTDVFSSFRGTLSAPAACMLAASSSPEATMEKAIACYIELKDNFFPTQYLALAALIMAEVNVGTRAAEFAARSRAIYDAMNKEHPLLTSSEDTVFTVFMAFSNKQDDVLLNDAEQCYEILKGSFMDSNSVQTVSHILALSEGSPRYKTDRLIGLFEALRARGVKYGKSYELPVLAALSVLEPDQSEAVSDILRADEFLSAQKGYGFWGLDKRTRLMHAAMLESDLLCRKNGVWSADFAEVSDATGQNAAMASMIAMIAAQQAASCAVIAGSSASAASAH